MKEAVVVMRKAVSNDDDKMLATGKLLKISRMIMISAMVITVVLLLMNLKKVNRVNRMIFLLPMRTVTRERWGEREGEKGAAE